MAIIAATKHKDWLVRVRVCVVPAHNELSGLIRCTPIAAIGEHPPLGIEAWVVKYFSRRLASKNYDTIEREAIQWRRLKSQDIE